MRKDKGRSKQGMASHPECVQVCPVLPISSLPLSDIFLLSTNAIKQLRALTGALNQPGASTNKKISAKSALADCCICTPLPTNADLALTLSRH